MRSRLTTYALTLLVLLTAARTSIRSQEPSTSVSAIYERLRTVEIKTIKIDSKLYALKGEEDGGTVGVLAGPDGILMVDAQYAPLGEKIVAAIHQISDGKIRFLINTHAHMDHTDGNARFGEMGAVIFARAEVRTQLEHGSVRTNGTPVPPTPAAGLPVVTYESPVTIHFNGENVELIPVPHAHTGGDTMVKFPESDAIMCGDVYGYHIPNIDRGTGGSLQGLLDGLGVLISLSGVDTKIIPGHGPIADRAAVIERRDMLMVLRDRVARLIATGATKDQAIAAKPMADFEPKFPQRGHDADRLIGEIYAELTTSKPNSITAPN